MKSFAFLLMAVVAVHVSGQAVIEPSCGENEESTECVGCRRTCEEVKPPICNKMCSPGCDCVPGYYRNVEGECVDMSKCACPPNQVFGGEGSCPPICGVETPKMCNMMVRLGCVCEKGYIWENERKLNCIPVDKCQPQPEA